MLRPGRLYRRDPRRRHHGLRDVERFWQCSGFADPPAAIGALLPDCHWVYRPSFDVHLAPLSGRPGEPGLPLDNRRRQFGDMVLSRWPILASRTVILPKTRDSERFNMTPGSGEYSIMTGAGGDAGDCAFVSPDPAHRIEASWIDREAVASDHQPVWLELRDL